VLTLGDLTMVRVANGCSKTWHCQSRSQLPWSSWVWTNGSQDLRHPILYESHLLLPHPPAMFGMEGQQLFRCPCPTSWSAAATCLFVQNKSSPCTEECNVFCVRGLKAWSIHIGSWEWNELFWTVSDPDPWNLEGGSGRKAEAEAYHVPSMQAQSH